MRPHAARLPSRARAARACSSGSVEYRLRCRRTQRLARTPERRARGARMRAPRSGRRFRRQRWTRVSDSLFILNAAPPLPYAAPSAAFPHEPSSYNPPTPVVASFMAVHDAIDAFDDPYLERSWKALGALRDVRHLDGKWYVQVALGYPAAGLQKTLAARLEALVGAPVRLDLQFVVPPAPTTRAAPVRGVAHIVAVASGKGG